MFAAAGFACACLQAGVERLRGGRVCDRCEANTVCYMYIFVAVPAAVRSKGCVHKVGRNYVMGRTRVCTRHGTQKTTHSRSSLIRSDTTPTYNA